MLITCTVKDQEMDEFLAGMNITPKDTEKIKEIVNRRGYKTLRSYLYFLRKNQKFTYENIAKSLGVGICTIRTWI